MIIKVYDVVENIEFKERQISVLNKNDITKHPKILFKDCAGFSISAKTGAGISNLKNAIFEVLVGEPTNAIGLSLTSKRQAESIRLTIKCIKNTSSLLRTPTPELELVCFELRDAISQLDRVLGTTTTDDVLEKVFSDFCVGK